MKTEMVPVRMDREMLSKLDEQKRKRKLRGRSEVIREAVDLYFKSDQPQLTHELIEEFKGWRKEFHGVGSNLNQVAYRMNADHPLSSSQIVEMLTELQATFKMLAINVKRTRSDLGI